MCSTSSLRRSRPDSIEEICCAVSVIIMSFEPDEALIFEVGMSADVLPAGGTGCGGGEMAIVPGIRPSLRELGLDKMRFALARVRSRGAHHPSPSAALYVSRTVSISLRSSGFILRKRTTCRMIFGS